MALTLTHKEIKFAVGDTIRVHQKIVESGKTRTAIFEGMVIAIKGENLDRTFTVRRIGAAKIGIEQIFPLNNPSLEKIEIKRAGGSGIRHAKLYYTREKSTKEIEAIYSRAKRKNMVVPQKLSKPTVQKKKKSVKSKEASK